MAENSNILADIYKNRRNRLQKIIIRKQEVKKILQKNTEGFL